MKIQRRDAALLREYVRVILEDEAGGNPAGYGGGDIGMSSMGGAQFGSGQDLINTFITPFTDVFKTAVGKSKEIARKTRTLLNVSIRTILTTLIPLYNYHYAEVFDKEKEDIEKIRSQYKDVYDRTEAALKGPDAMLLAFMASPSVVLGAMAAKQAPKVTRAAFDVISGGLSEELYEKFATNLKKLGRWSLGDKGGSSSSSSRGSKRRRDPRDVIESQLQEADDDKKTYDPKKLLQSKKIIAAVAGSPKAQEMAATAKEAYRKTLKEIEDQAENVLRRMKTIDDIEKFAGKKTTPKLKEDIKKIKELPNEEKASATKTLLDGVRKASKEFYVKSLKQRVAEVVEAGIPEEADFVKDHRALIAKISAM